MYLITTSVCTNNHSVYTMLRMCLSFPPSVAARQALTLPTSGLFSPATLCLSFVHKNALPTQTKHHKPWIHIWLGASKFDTGIGCHYFVFWALHYTSDAELSHHHHACNNCLNFCKIVTRKLILFKANVYSSTVFHSSSYIVQPARYVQIPCK